MIYETLFQQNYDEAEKSLLPKNCGQPSVDSIHDYQLGHRRSRSEEDTGHNGGSECEPHFGCDRREAACWKQYWYFDQFEQCLGSVKASSFRNAHAWLANQGVRYHTISKHPPYITKKQPRRIVKRARAYGQLSLQCEDSFENREPRTENREPGTEGLNSVGSGSGNVVQAQFCGSGAGVWS